MAEAISAVPAISFPLRRTMRRPDEEEEPEESNFERWLAEPSTLSNDSFMAPIMSLEDEVFLGRMRNARAHISRPKPLTNPYVPVPSAMLPPPPDAEGQYAFEFLNKEAPALAGARLDETI